MMHGRRYLFLSEDRGPDPTIGTTPRVNSTLWVLSDGGQFEAVQSIATDGAQLRGLAALSEPMLLLHGGS